MKSTALSYGFLLSFLTSLLLWRWFLPANAVFIALASASLGCIALLLPKGKGRIAGAVLFAVALSLLSAIRTVHVTTAKDIEAWARDTRVTVTGWITEPPDARPTMTKLTIDVSELRDASGTHDVRGRVLLNNIGGWPELRYGAHVEATGVLRKPKIIDDFDYPHYLELSGVRAVMPRSTVRAIEDAPPPSSIHVWRIVGILTDLRTAMEDRIGLILPEPHASLLAGLLTGTRRGLPADLSDAFRRAGLTHIVAVSGYNVTIILTLIGGLFFWVPVRRRFLPLAISAGLFALFVGAGAPVVRAAVMGVLGLFALSVGRVPTVRLLILWTAFFMTALKPLMLWYDASFQLSFLAVIGLSELSPWLKTLFARVPETLAMRESLTATVAAQIATLPLSIILFHQFSLVAPLSNVLVAPLIPLAMLVGFVSTLLGWIWVPLGLVPGYYAWFILECIMKIATVSASLPLSAILF